MKNEFNFNVNSRPAIIWNHSTCHEYSVTNYRIVLRNFDGGLHLERASELDAMNRLSWSKVVDGEFEWYYYAQLQLIEILMEENIIKKQFPQIIWTSPQKHIRLILLDDNEKYNYACTKYMGLTSHYLKLLMNLKIATS